MDKYTDHFVSGGIYSLNILETDKNIFLCLPTGGSYIAKLVMYRPVMDKGDTFEKTSTSYFLNCYKPDDIKSLFLNRDNYEMVGKIGINYCLSDDQNYILKGVSI